MPLPKRVIEPIYVSRGTVPDPAEYSLPSELETVTNGSLANAIRQLSSLSRHAEDLFGELAREAHSLATRANSLQARLDKLAIKTTQLDSTVEEVSLQEMHMRKAYKSASIFDQQVVSRDTMPTAMLETYNQCDKPPPLYKLNPYREDDKDGMKFYTDPDYFFHLWRQEILKDTERMMHDKGKRPHKIRSADSSGGRHKKDVRQPHSTRERHTEIVKKHGELIMHDSKTIYAPSYIQQLNYEYENDSAISSLSNDQRPSRPSSIELQRNYSQHVVDGGRGIYSPTSIHRHSPTDIYGRGTYSTSIAGQEDIGNYYHQQHVVSHPQHIMSPPLTNGHIVNSGITSPISMLNNEVLSPNGTPTRSSKNRPSQPPPAPPSTTNSSNSTPSSNTPTRGRSMSSGRETLPPPPPPPVDPSTPPTDLPPPPPTNIPPPPPPPPPPPDSGSATQLANGDVCKSPSQANIPSTSPSRVSSPKQTLIEDNYIANTVVAKKPTCMGNNQQYDLKSDLLKAIRDGIKLRKVEKIEQKEVEKVNTLQDVASILSRRVRLELSDSDSQSDDSYDGNGWSEDENTKVTLSERPRS